MHMHFTEMRTAAILAAGVLAASAAVAQTPAEQTTVATNPDEIVRYSGTVVRSMPNTRPFELRLDRWSTEADRNAVVGAFKTAETPAAFAKALAEMPIIGGFRTVSGQANPIRYAEEVTTTDGTRALIVLSDRHVDYWDGGSAPDVVKEGYTLMEIRFEDDGGQGVVSHGPTKVVVDEQTDTLSIADFEAKPAQLIGVARLEKDDEFDFDRMMDDMVDAISRN